jgi:L,D-peptidoglycan transpeptidase YkuD (ErfK/YbiS/YcfS/YnhG family)
MAKSILYLFLFHGLAIGLFSKTAHAKEPENPGKKALRIAKKNTALLDSISQLLVVFNQTPESSTSLLVALEKKDGNWRVATVPVEAGIGRNGFATPGAKREGDNQSPSGLFRLGQLYSYDKEVNTRMPYIQTSPEDKWIDDPDSPDYNRHIRGATQAESYENLKISSNEYQFCLVIEYNTHPVVKGMGSAIFLHLSMGDAPNPSSGCVVVTPLYMKWLLKWLDPESKPSILMGNEKVLSSKLN